MVILNIGGSQVKVIQEFLVPVLQLFYKPEIIPKLKRQKIKNIFNVHTFSSKIQIIGIYTTETITCTNMFAEALLIQTVS